MRLEFELSVIQLIVSHQIENCELYEIKFSILKTTNSEIIKSCFFWIIHENDFQIFNADWLKSKKTKFDAKITITVIFQIKKISDAKITITMFFQIDIRTHKFRNFCYKTDERILIISKNFDEKKNACKTFRVHVDVKYDRISIKSRHASWSLAKQTSNSKKCCLHFFVQQQAISRVTCNWSTLLDLFVQLNRQNDYIIKSLQDN